MQAPDQIIAVIVLVNNLLSDDQRRPEFGLFGSETHHGADISLAREIEAGRRYADYRHAYTAELDAFDDNGGITCKPACPQLMAENDDMSACPQLMAENDDMFVPKGCVFREETTAPGGNHGLEAAVSRKHERNPGSPERQTGVRRDPSR